MRWPFRLGKSDAQTVAKRLVDPQFECRCCGQRHNPPFATPDPAGPFTWPDPPAPAPDRAIMAGGDVITENYCRKDEDHLLRAYLPLRVAENGGRVFLGVWASLSAENFGTFRAAQDKAAAAPLGDMFSWLYTAVPPGGPVLTAGVLVPFDGGRRPLFWITDPSHPLYPAQQDGLPCADVLALYGALGAPDLMRHLEAR